MKPNQIAKLHPSCDHLSQRLSIQRRGREEFSLNHYDLRFIIVDKDGINLLIVSPVGYIVMCLDRVSQVNVSEVPGQREPLTVIWEVLLEVVCWMSSEICDTCRSVALCRSIGRVSDLCGLDGNRLACCEIRDRLISGNRFGHVGKESVLNSLRPNQIQQPKNAG